MTPKEKAEELVDKFIQYVPAEEEFEWDYAKQCALIAVDEIQKIKSVYHDDTLYDYWQEVEQGIINIKNK
jgi:hypothetical protein